MDKWLSAGPDEALIKPNNFDRRKHKAGGCSGNPLASWIQTWSGHRRNTARMRISSRLRKTTSYDARIKRDLLHKFEVETSWKRPAGWSRNRWEDNLRIKDVVRLKGDSEWCPVPQSDVSAVKICWLCYRTAGPEIFPDSSSQVSDWLDPKKRWTVFRLGAPSWEFLHLLKCGG